VLDVLNEGGEPLNGLHAGQGACEYGCSRGCGRESVRKAIIEAREAERASSKGTLNSQASLLRVS
jgi:hypothetical protein